MKHAADRPAHDWLREHAARCPDDGTRTFTPAEMAVTNAALDEAYARHRRKGLVWRESELTAIREGRDPAWARFVADSEPEPPRRRHSADDQSLNPAVYAKCGALMVLALVVFGGFALALTVRWGEWPVIYALIVSAVFAWLVGTRATETDEGRRHNGR